jgi:hypothetical protein
MAWKLTKKPTKHPIPFMPEKISCLKFWKAVDFPEESLS